VERAEDIRAAAGVLLPIGRRPREPAPGTAQPSVEEPVKDAVSVQETLAFLISLARLL
jgi:hypothetical protein